MQTESLSEYERRSLDLLERIARRLDALGEDMRVVRTQTAPRSIPGVALPDIGKIVAASR